MSAVDGPRRAQHAGSDPVPARSQVVAIYGALKAGAAYVPVNFDAPPSRKQFLVAQSEAKVVIAVRSSESMTNEFFHGHSVLLRSHRQGCLQHQRRGCSAKTMGLT